MKYSEADTRAKFIDPKLKESGWSEDYVIREHSFTDGRKIIGNKRGTRLIADYLLKYKNVSLAIIEAKRFDKEPTEGLSQAIDYAEKLKIDFVYSTNGEKVYEFRLSEGKGGYVDSFPGPEELYRKQYQDANDLKEKLHAESMHLVGTMKPRYYQEIAINRTLEAIADGNRRMLLTLATGTGKTFISFQIAYKLFKARWNLDGADRQPKILFLADRNVLADQAINTFNPLEKDLVKINGDEIKQRGGKVPTNANIFFAIYQAISEKENIAGHYKQYPKDFFDLVIIDECHRGGANEAGTWRSILDHFESAIHLGLTATPKRTDNVDTYNYFGQPIYEYSLKEGINDGFLTPYKVKRIKTNIDEYVFTEADTVIEGEIEEKVYKIPDFHRNLVITQRDKLIAKAILDNMIHPLDKTIVFCVNQTHALLLRDAINEYKTIKDPHYCVRVTSDEGGIGRQMLERFQDNDKDIPAILTSSQMLSTGVDARNVRNIVLVRTINSMVEFKQIVGRGTRVFEGKDFFTIMDFTGATELFYDDEWDGIPEEETKIKVSDISDKQEKQPREPKEYDDTYEDTGEEESPRKKKAVVELSNGRMLKIIDVETRYIGEDGRPLTASQFLEKLIGHLPELYKDETQLRKAWSNPETREALLERLAGIGFDEEQLNVLRDMFAAKDSDIFDVLAHLSFNKDILKRSERAENTKHDESLFEGYEDIKAKDFIYFILERYMLDGIKELGRDRLPDLIKLKKLGTIKDAATLFGGTEKLLDAFYKLQESLYKVG